MLRLYRGLGSLGRKGWDCEGTSYGVPFGETGAPSPAPTPGPPDPLAPTPEELTIWTIIRDTGTDVETAVRASKYVGELGALSPKCVMRGWKVIRDHLIERTERLYRLVESTAPNEIRADTLTPVRDMAAIAKGLPPPLENAPIVDLGPQWEEPDPGLSETVTIPRDPEGKGLVEYSGEFCALLARNGVPLPEECLRGDTTWERAAQMWDQNRGTAFLLGYFAMQPYIRPAGPIGDIIYWGGVGVYEIGSGVADWFRARAATTEQVAELGRLNEMHKKFMEDEIRAIYRQCRAIHRIAKEHRTGAAQTKALMETDPRKEPEMPPVWDGTMPDIDRESFRLPWWLLALTAAAGVGGMALLED